MIEWLLHLFFGRCGECNKLTNVCLFFSDYIRDAIEGFYASPNSTSIEELLFALTYVPKLFQGPESPFHVGTVRDVIILFDALESSGITKNKKHVIIGCLHNSAKVKAEIEKMRKQTNEIKKFVYKSINFRK